MRNLPLRWRAPRNPKILRLCGLKGEKQTRKFRKNKKYSQSVISPKGMLKMLMTREHHSNRENPLEDDYEYIARTRHRWFSLHKGCYAIPSPRGLPPGRKGAMVRKSD